jgi:GNAT superfamily N-acetyltransferase
MLRGVRAASAEVVAAALALAATLGAQMAAGGSVTRPAWRVLAGELRPAALATAYVSCSRGIDVGRFAAEAPCLSRLRRRFVTMDVVVLAPDAGGDAKAWPECVIVLDGDAAVAQAWFGDESARVLLVDARGKVVFRGAPEAGLVDAMEAVAEGRDVTPFAGLPATREQVLDNLHDAAPDFLLRALDRGLATAPRDGTLLGLAYVVEALRHQDRGAATAILDTAVVRLVDEPRPLAAFADLVLRADPRGPGVGAALLAPLGRAAELTPEDPFVRLALLRALVVAGDPRAVPREAARMQRHALLTPTAALDFAAVLTGDRQPLIHRDRALMAVERAEALGAEPRLLAAVRYGVLLRCAEDREARLKLLDDYLFDQDVRAGINNDCWHLLTDLRTVGRCDWFAAALADRMLEQREAMEAYEFDTAALAMFATGRIAEAVDLQATAVRMAGGDHPGYAERLERYRASLPAAPR